ncbi:hypothetical protein ACYJ1Y_17425 [Natrialbaceae archaeon A-gly3]
MSRGFELQWTPRHGSPRKLVFEPQPDGEYPWARIEFERHNAQWRQTGVEYLTEIGVTTGPHPTRVPAGGGDDDE